MVNNPNNDCSDEDEEVVSKTIDEDFYNVSKVCEVWEKGFW
ncbi:MAG: hypothetical protein U0L16_03210 [Phocaeicola sp.]|nr:hypothetical protein [Phocaeicola sp.]